MDGHTGQVVHGCNRLRFWTGEDDFGNRLLVRRADEINCLFRFVGDSKIASGDVPEPVGVMPRSRPLSWREEFASTLPDLREKDIAGSGFAMIRHAPLD